MLLPLLTLLCCMQSRPILALSRSYRSTFPYINRDDPNYNSTCSSDPWWAKPISVNLGMHSITAAYAHSDTDISIIAYIDTKDPAGNLTLYGDLMYDLRQEYEKQLKAPPEKPQSELQRRLRIYWWEQARRIEMVWDLAFGWWPLLQEAVAESTSPYLRPARVVMSSLAPAIEEVTRRFKTQANKIGLFPSVEGDALAARKSRVSTIFADAIARIKAKALQETGINISAALVTYPDFLDQAHGRRWYQTDIQYACERAGVETMAMLPGSDKLLIHEHSSLLWDTRSPRNRVSRDFTPNVIVLDQGLWHFDATILGRFCWSSRPVEGLGCSNVIDKWTSDISKGRLVQEELRQGASFERFSDEIIRAREHLKAAHDANQGQIEDAPEEWPLNLDGWWVGKHSSPISLRWSDVKMVDDLYGDALLDALREARSCVIREANKCKAPSNATIDGVVILNSYCDASLLTAAIREAFGDQVEIFGSTTGQDVTYVARLGARAALRLRDLAVSDVEHACKYAGRDEEDELWYELHGEL